jgi:D-alanyl-D-alanine carboxypeptidase
MNMRFINRQYLFIVAVLSVLLVGCDQNTSNSPTIIKTGVKSTIGETLDSYLTANIDENGPGMAIRVIKDNETVYTGFAGLANIHTLVPIDSNTGFRIASISKTFTALAIMQLKEQSLLFLDDSILTYLPEFSAKWQGITIAHLLSHQSGIPDFSTDTNVITDWHKRLTNEVVLQYFVVNDTLEFEPGSQGQYSNTGYVLLAEIVSRISGLTFSDHMEQHIFSPILMTNTFINDELAVAVDNTALNFGEFTTIKGRQFYVSGASGIISSIEDMNKFMSSLLTGEIVSQASLTLMQKSHTKILFPGSNVDYGYGSIVDPNGNNAFLHTGSNDGFQSFMLIDRETNGKLLILGNSGNQAADHGYIQQLITDFYSKSY